MAECVVCQRQPPERPMVCEGCRQRVIDHLRQIVDLYATLPAMLEPGASTGQRVSGSREAPIPVRLDPLDLSLPLRGSQAVRDPYGDQTGMVPVVWRLDSWARDWQTTLVPDQRLPVPTVATLAGWLRDRLDLACRHHPAVDEFAAEMRQTVAALDQALGRVPPKPEPCCGVECDRCDLRLLHRRADGSGDVECHNQDCRRVMRASEYADWVRWLGAYERGRAA